MTGIKAEDNFPVCFKCRRPYFVYSGNHVPGMKKVSASLSSFTGKLCRTCKEIEDQENWSSSA